MTYTQKVTIGDATLYQGDCIEVMSGMADNSVDSIVCDPPYLLGFMGKAWDAADGIAGKSDVWREALRVLKPGGHLLAFGAPRTNHRMVTAIEDAGFEIRDSVMWLFGSGFPKSLNIGKAIDKAAGAVREVVGFIDMRGAYEPGKAGPNSVSGGGSQCAGNLTEKKITAPATPAAQQWQGFGTALKPAFEPVCVARKPLDKSTVAANVLAWGVGGINIDGCRIGIESTLRKSNAGTNGDGWGMGAQSHVNGSSMGRWPANIILDGSPEVLAGFPETKSGALTAAQQVNGGFKGTINCYGTAAAGGTTEFSANQGSAARYFYTAKASKSDRDDGNTHCTVKPTDLMAYLCRLVTPPGALRPAPSQ